MIRLTLDKIASVTKNALIEREVYLSEEIKSSDGYIVAARVLTDKIVYNKMENVHGRMMRLIPGDKIAGALGSRRASMGYAGIIPRKIKKGDILQILNMGGVIGKCTSFARDVGKPFDVEILGAVLNFPHLGKRIAEHAHIKKTPCKTACSLRVNLPVVAVVGTSMNCGKTMAACQIVEGLTKKGFKVAGAKATGVALQRDVLKMSDYGAEHVISFLDAGCTSTSPENAVQAYHAVLNELNTTSCDVVVMEMGDGLLGEYGVQSILKDKSITASFAAIVLCASSQVGANGAVKLLEDDYSLVPCVCAGRVTDNEVGIRYLTNELGIQAANSFLSPLELTKIVFEEIKKYEAKNKNN